MREKLTTAFVRSVAKKGRYGDGGGLYLQVVSDSSKAWLFRYEREAASVAWGSGRRGLSAWHAPANWRRNVRRRSTAALIRSTSGIPIVRRNGVAAAKRVSFRDASAQYVAAHRAGWKNAKHAAQVTSSLETHVFPTIGDLDVRGDRQGPGPEMCRTDLASNTRDREPRSRTHRVGVELGLGARSPTGGRESGALERTPQLRAAGATARAPSHSPSLRRDRGVHASAASRGRARRKSSGIHHFDGGPDGRGDRRQVERDRRRCGGVDGAGRANEVHARAPRAVVGSHREDSSRSPGRKWRRRREAGAGERQTGTPRRTVSGRRWPTAWFCFRGGSPRPAVEQHGDAGNAPSHGARCPHCTRLPVDVSGTGQPRPQRTRTTLWKWLWRTLSATRSRRRIGAEISSANANDSWPTGRSTAIAQPIGALHPT